MADDTNKLKVAAMRWYGHSRAKTSEKLGIPETTIRHWEEGPDWGEFVAKAAQSARDKTLGKARQTVDSILTRGLKEDAPIAIVREASKVAQWYIERQDPAFKVDSDTQGARELAKIREALGKLSLDDLALLAPEPVILGFPTNDEHTAPASNRDSKGESS